MKLNPEEVKIIRQFERAVQKSSRNFTFRVTPEMYKNMIRNGEHILNGKSNRSTIVSIWNGNARRIKRKNLLAKKSLASSRLEKRLRKSAAR